MKALFVKILLLGTLAGIVLVSGCKRKFEEDPYLGTGYIPAPADFSVVPNTFTGYVWNEAHPSPLEPPFDLTINPHPYYVNKRMSFIGGSLKSLFQAKFSHKVSWKITITSTRTRAVKELSGTSQQLDHTNALWDGSSSNVYFFASTQGPTDSVQAVLSFVGTDLSYSINLYLADRKPYDGRILSNGAKCYFIDNMEPADAKPNHPLSPFYPDLLDLGGGNTGNNAFNGEKVDGTYSYRMYGTDVNNNTYIGSCNTNTLDPIPAGTFTSGNNENVYINLYIYGTGRPNTTVSVIAFERDNVSSPFNQAINDKWLAQIPVTWTGWKLYSLKYSTFRKPNTGGGLGNNTLESTKLCGFALELDSYPTEGKEVEAYLDYFTVTEGGPFVP